MNAGHWAAACEGLPHLEHGATALSTTLSSSGRLSIHLHIHTAHNQMLQRGPATPMGPPIQHYRRGWASVSVVCTSMAHPTLTCIAVAPMRWSKLERVIAQQHWCLHPRECHLLVVHATEPGHACVPRCLPLCPEATHAPDLQKLHDFSFAQKFRVAM